MVSSQSLFVVSLLLCQFDAITLNFLTNRSKANRVVSSDDDFQHKDDIHSKTHLRLVVSSEDLSQYKANLSDGRHFIQKLSQGMSSLNEANEVASSVDDLHQTGDIHSQTHHRLATLSATDLQHEANHSNEARFITKLPQGMSFLHDAVNSLTKAHGVASSPDDFHHAGDLHSKTRHRASSAEDFRHEPNHSNGSHVISKVSQGVSLLQTGYTHILHLGAYRQRQLWGMPMMTWAIVADVFAMLLFFVSILFVLNCARTRRPTLK